MQNNYEIYQVKVPYDTYIYVQTVTIAFREAALLAKHSSTYKVPKQE